MIGYFATASSVISACFIDSEIFFPENINQADNDEVRLFNGSLYEDGLLT